MGLWREIKDKPRKSMQLQCGCVWQIVEPGYVVGIESQCPPCKASWDAAMQKNVDAQDQWVEDQIFGGEVKFEDNRDRGKPKTDED